jgi:hypothetical protein
MAKKKTKSRTKKEMKSDGLPLWGWVLIVIFVLWIFGYFIGDSEPRHSSSSQEKSGKLCTYMYSESGFRRTAGCPTGETCTKSSRDLDGDGIVCSKVATKDGILFVCDGTCS